MHIEWHVKSLLQSSYYNMMFSGSLQRARVQCADRATHAAIKARKFSQRKVFLSSASSSIVCSAIKARWSLDARYGHKADVTALMQEWVQAVGSVAGLTSSNTQLTTGSVGTPESRLELEVTMDSLADWEDFLGRIPAQQHKAWSQRMQGLVVDGSLTWTIQRVVPVFTEGEIATAAVSSTANTPAKPKSVQIKTSTAAASPLTAALSAQPSSSGLILTGVDFENMTLDDLLKAQEASGDLPSMSSRIPDTKPSSPIISTATSDPTSSADLVAEEGEEIVLDWKGDPMKIKKGDRMPRFL